MQREQVSEEELPAIRTLAGMAMDQGEFSEDSVVFMAATERPNAPAIAPGEALQLVRYSKRQGLLQITGLTPHGRRLTFEQREHDEGWYVVVAGRRRRPTQRELGLVLASITQEMEAAMLPPGDEDVRSAYRLAASSDQPGLLVRGLQAYRDLLLDEAAAYQAGQTERLAVVAIEYQAFKRFALRHGHKIGADFVRALGERLYELFAGQKKLHVCHKAGKSFRMIVVDRTSAEIAELVSRLVCDETRRWLVQRVWGNEGRTAPEEVHFYVGFALAREIERRGSDYVALAQRISDDAYRAAKLGQLKGYPSLQIAKSAYRSSVTQWVRTSEDELDELANQMDDGPGDVMSEMSDYLHELVPADLEGMAVEGDLDALLHKAIARDGFWQGTTAMRIAGGVMLDRFVRGAPIVAGQNNFVSGFDLGDEFYSIVVEGDRLHFAWGDLNSAGATRVRVGLGHFQHAVGWRRLDGGGVVGRVLAALESKSNTDVLGRLRWAAQTAYAELAAEPDMHVNDAVDIADYLWNKEHELVKNADLKEGAELTLSLPGERYRVRVLERRSGFILRLSIDGVEQVASVADSVSGPYVKLRLRGVVLSAAICVLDVRRAELLDIIQQVREENGIAPETPLDILGFLRHIADILLAEQVKNPGKIALALGAKYDATDFVKTYTLDLVRRRYPGLFYEAVHQNLLVEHPPLSVDRHLAELIARTMLSHARPSQW